MDGLVSHVHCGRRVALLIAAGVVFLVGAPLANYWEHRVAKVPQSRAAAPTTIDALKQLRGRCHNDAVGIFERRSISAVIDGLSRHGAADASVSGTILGAAVRPAWWYMQPDILEIDILYLESPQGAGFVRFSDAYGNKLYDAPFVPSQGTMLSPTLSYYNLKCYLDAHGRLLDSGSLTLSNRLAPDALPPDDQLINRIRRLRACTVESGGKTSATVKLVVVGTGELKATQGRTKSEEENKGS